MKGRRQKAESRKTFLDDIPLSDAVLKWNQALEEAGVGLTECETVPLSSAPGRVVAEPVHAVTSSPHYHAAAMDGVAVVAWDTRGASEASPVRLRIGGNATWVDTGDPLPEDRDAVIMIERLHEMEDDEIEIVAPVAPWHHVRSMGEDIVESELIVQIGERLRPYDIGALAAGGVTEVKVRRKPRIAILPSGTELVPPGAVDIRPGDIIEFNSMILSSQLTEWGADPFVLPIAKDELPTLREKVRDAVTSHDVLLVIAGSSAGTEDFTARIVEELGTLIVHGVAIRPGHPQILGIIEGKPVFGMPGYPVSTALNAEIFVRPLIERMIGVAARPRETIEAIATRKIVSPIGEDEYVRVRCARVGDRILASPLPRGAGRITTLSRADGLVVIPAASEGVHMDNRVEVQLIRSRTEIENTILISGSHDLAIDLVATQIARLHPSVRIVSTNVGSLGGLVALQRGHAHLAGCHLLDEETGEYNLPFVKRMLQDQRVVVRTLVHREQGLIVAKGNPKGLRGIEGLVAGGIRFMNRQRGSGTRILLDHELSVRAISPDAIAGYEREEYTHLAVAAAVKSGAADTGLGVYAAARALDLDFVPVARERYDLVIPENYYNAEMLRPLREILESPPTALLDAIGALGGYETSQTGQLVEGTRLG